jgi:hypothetical protein
VSSTVARWVPAADFWLLLQHKCSQQPFSGDRLFLLFFAV